MGQGKEDKQQDNYDLDETLTDEEVLSYGVNAENGDFFNELLEGNWQDCGRNYPSQSEGDQAFMNLIVFYSRNRNQSARIFRNSPLGARRKAERPDYMQRLLDKAGDELLPPFDSSGLVNPFLKGE